MMRVAASTLDETARTEPAEETPEALVTVIEDGEQSRMTWAAVSTSERVFRVFFPTGASRQGTTVPLP